MSSQRRGGRPVRIWFQRATEAADSTGEMIETWSDLFDMWAFIRPASGGGERWLQNNEYQETVWDFSGRWDSRMETLTNADRIRWGDRVLELVTIDNFDQMGRDAKLRAREVVAG